MRAVGVALIFGGLYLCYTAYEAIHGGNSTAATPLTKAKAAIA